VRRLRPLSEAECYARCYGAGEDTVRFMKVEPRRPRHDTHVSGEDLRQAFEQRLDSREPAPHEHGPHEHAPTAIDGHEPAAAA
jgi:hypothetical protein